MEILDEHNLGSNSISQKAADEIKGTIGWIKFAAIFGMIQQGLSLLSSLSSGSVNFIGIGLSAFYIFIFVVLLQSGNSYESFVKNGNSTDLEKALEKQKQYWQIMSILVIIGAVALLIGVLALFAVGGRLLEQFF